MPEITGLAEADDVDVMDKVEGLLRVELAGEGEGLQLPAAVGRVVEEPEAG